MTRQVDEIRAVILRELPRLRRFAFSLTGCKADADDLLQDVVVRVLKVGLPAAADPVPWLLRVCKNLWIDEIRSRNVRLRAADKIKLDTDVESDGEQLIHNRLNMERVMQAMATLSENQRVALSLVAVDGASYAEAADVLEVPIGTIMSRVARARENLNRYFQDETEAVAR